MTQFAQPGYPPTYAPPAQPQYAPPPQFQQPVYQQPPAQFPVQQGYPQPQMAAPAQPLAQGSLDDFYNQQSTGGGKSLAFEQPGQSYVGIVARPLSSGDIQQQTDTQGKPLFFRDGSPKFVMKVPLQMEPSPTHPDGLGTWYVKGATRDELVRAMAEAGAPVGPPEAGAAIQITFTSTRQSGPGMNPAKIFSVAYQRPGVITPAPAQPQAAPVVQQPVQQYVPPVIQQPQVQASYAQQPVQQVPAQPAVQPPQDFNAEQQALMARLTGQQ
ncbi:hypothetical protein SAMN05892883_2098 [Jatrophihabitans sp. GAS493]|uniref:hypothetical protein n=1 Tax=Jatrophihabitans sp. GAS493 TaxID=1907575 RepID=UPI000BB796DD|nr:hypothetical protein [Jatrophihabitans sp. GAS493]SOD72753.1 hypothetical protein SAMN05892883_2098 [Jatrophihabitans sp. GAS493]